MPVTQQCANEVIQSIGTVFFIISHQANVLFVFTFLDLVTSQNSLSHTQLISLSTFSNQVRSGYMYFAYLTLKSLA